MGSMDKKNSPTIARHLDPIGTFTAVEAPSPGGTAVIGASFRKALQDLSRFSHCHLIYSAPKRNEALPFYLRPGRIREIDVREGRLTLTGAFPGGTTPSGTSNPTFLRRIVSPPHRPLPSIRNFRTAGL